MGLFNRFKGHKLKPVARRALEGICMEEKRLSAFIPFLQIFDAEGNMRTHNCVAPTNEAAQDMGYEMIAGIRERDSEAIRTYTLVFIGNYDPDHDSMRPLIAECGAANADKAVLYGIAFKEDDRHLLKKLPGVYRIRETANALHQRKSFAVRTVSERGSYISTYMARIPLVLTYLTAFELGNFNGRMPSEAWDLYRRLLEEWSSRQISIGYLMAAFSLQAISENRVDQLMPREGITLQTMQSALHIGNQILIEAVRTGRIALEDLKLTMNELSAYVNRLAGFMGNGKSTENLQGLRVYLQKMATDPLAQSAPADER
jgi:hypothetical protein